jgi:hypothetical protein
MALVSCEECNAQISDRAESCPKCGCPIDNTPQIDANVPLTWYCTKCGLEAASSQIEFKASKPYCINCWKQMHGDSPKQPIVRIEAASSDSHADSLPIQGVEEATPTKKASFVTALSSPVPKGVRYTSIGLTIVLLLSIFVLSFMTYPKTTILITILPALVITLVSAIRGNSDDTAFKVILKSRLYETHSVLFLWPKALFANLIGKVIVPAVCFPFRLLGAMLNEIVNSSPKPETMKAIAGTTFGAVVVIVFIVAMNSGGRGGSNRDTSKPACPKCYGSGRGDTISCPLCGGQGRLNHGYGDLCGACGGSGKFTPKCAVCNGSGVKPDR